MTGRAMAGATNNQIVGARSWSRARPVLLHPKFFEGFRDFAEGRPFDYRRLDGWTLLDQHRYENGREIAAECQAAGIAVRWGERTRIPRGLKALVVGRARLRSGRDAGPVLDQSTMNSLAPLRVAERWGESPKSDTW